MFISSQVPSSAQLAKQQLEKQIKPGKTCTKLEPFGAHLAECPTLTPLTLNSARARLILEAAVFRSFPLAMTFTSNES